MKEEAKGKMQVVRQRREGRKRVQATLYATRSQVQREKKRKCDMQKRK